MAVDDGSAQGEKRSIRNTEHHEPRGVSLNMQILASKMTAKVVGRVLGRQRDLGKRR